MNFRLRYASLDERRANRAAGRGARVLFVQATEPAAYPPLIHASTLMADAGWEVTFLSAPIAGKALTIPDHPRIDIRAIPERPSHVMSKPAYARYLLAAASLAARLRPDVVYASDPLGAAPGLLAASVAGAQLVYHEHDSPEPGVLKPWLRRLRRAAARRALRVVFPNEQRAVLCRPELGCSDAKIAIVWNLPTLAELPSLSPPSGAGLVLYYHGSITPDRLPESVVRAAARFAGLVTLRAAGYEAPGAKGYIDHLVTLTEPHGGTPIAEYLGQVPRSDLLEQAAKAHVGLALMPSPAGDLNMRHMVGASNKAFDYMAAGLALLVSDLPCWLDTFAVPGFARACDPSSVESVADAYQWFLANPHARRNMGVDGRAKIVSSWNYDSGFARVLSALA